MQWFGFLSLLIQDNAICYHFDANLACSRLFSFLPREETVHKLIQTTKNNKICKYNNSFWNGIWWLGLNIDNCLLYTEQALEKILKVVLTLAHLYFYSKIPHKRTNVWGFQADFCSYISGVLSKTNLRIFLIKAFLKLFLKIKYCIDYQQMNSMCKRNILTWNWLMDFMSACCVYRK